MCRGEREGGRFSPSIFWNLCSLKSSFVLHVLLLVLCEKGVQIVALAHNQLCISLNTYYLGQHQTDKHVHHCNLKAPPSHLG